MKTWPLLAAALLASACVTAQVYVPTEQASKLERQLADEERFLRVSMYVTPFFGDATRKLLTPVPPDEVRLLEDTSGKPIEPGAFEKIVPAGSRVRIVSLEFPSPRAMVERVLYTPRSLLWVRVEVAGSHNALPLVLVLRPGLRTESEVQTELERYLSREDPSRRMESWSESVREAVKTKKAALEMSPEALEMAWGYPELKRLEMLGSQKKELWRWPGTRQATLLDGRVTDFKP